MLIPFAIFIFLFLSIFFLSPHINTAIYNLTFLISRNKNFSTGVLIVFLLPGTIIHELSHFIIASILFVPSGNLSIFPKIEEGTIKAGSLHHADTDPIRRSLIGIAPMIIGIIIIYLIGNYLLSQISNFKFIIFNQFSISQFLISKLLITNYLVTLATFYLLLATSLSMFSSKKDLEIAGIFLPLIFFLILFLYWKGLRVSFTNSLSSQISQFLTHLDTYLFVTLCLDLIVFFILKGILLLLQKILKVKLTTAK